MSTLFVTSCEDDRSCSMLKLIKNPLRRNEMGPELLNIVVLMYCHSTITLIPSPGSPWGSPWY